MQSVVGAQGRGDVMGDGCATSHCGLGFRVSPLLQFAGGCKHWSSHQQKQSAHFCGGVVVYAGDLRENFNVC